MQFRVMTFMNGRALPSEGAFVVQPGTLSQPLLVKPLASTLVKSQDTRLSRIMIFSWLYFANAFDLILLICDFL